MYSGHRVPIHESVEVPELNISGLLFGQSHVIRIGSVEPRATAPQEWVKIDSGDLSSAEFSL